MRSKRMGKAAVAGWLPIIVVAAMASADPAVRVDPVTRYIHVAYRVPPDAGDQVIVLCSWSPVGKEEWRPAKVTPLISETAMRLVRDVEWREWTLKGRIVERRAAGLERTVVFRPYPEAQLDGKVDVDFRIELRPAKAGPATTTRVHVRSDNAEVVYIEDWSGVYQKDAIATEPDPGKRKWHWATGIESPDPPSKGDALFGRSAPDRPLTQLSYPLDLRGWYAIFVRMQPRVGVMLRLSGDERPDLLRSERAGEEVLWGWRRMDRQDLVLRQRHTSTGWAAAQIDYVKLVPLSPELRAELESPFAGKRDKLVAAYFEPYSWAFNSGMQDAPDHRPPLALYRDAGIDIVDIQIGRFGAKVVYESRIADRLLYGTSGDPNAAGVIPKTNNVGRMQQYTNTLDAELRYSRRLGLRAHANFGASNCYVGSPLQGDVSKKHPEWLRGHCLRFEVPGVQAYALGLYREALEIGAPAISLDFCRYPQTIDKPDTANAFLRKLRKLADEFGARRGSQVPILVRFPAKGVPRWELFDYATWAKEGLVDILVPSNIQNRHMHVDAGPYVEAAGGTRCKLLPNVEGNCRSIEMPGLYLWRVRQLYEAGAHGVYIYQADARLGVYSDDPRYMRLLASSEAVRRWWQRDADLRPGRSKGIYITPCHYRNNQYRRWERLSVWLEGIEMGEVELRLDGKLINRHIGPPYVLGSEEHASDGLITPGAHELRIRARDGDGWLEQTFSIHGL